MQSNLYAIFSVYRKENCPLVNKMNYSKVLVDYWQVLTMIEGKYKGELEKSFLSEDINLAIKLALEYKQESILLACFDGYYLLYLDSGELVKIGETLVEVTNPEKYESWTKINNKYYIVV